MNLNLTTLTTLFYGDITPFNVTDRSLANLKALIVQLYPAVLIAGSSRWSLYPLKIKGKIKNFGLKIIVFYAVKSISDSWRMFS